MPFDNRDPSHSPEVGLPAGRRLSAWGSALVALLLGLALTGWLARGEMHRAEGEARREFQLETARVADAIGSQLAQCEHLIRAFQSIFLASESVTQDEYTRAYENMESNAVVRISLQALAYAERRRLPDGDRYITTIFAPRQGNEVIQGLDVTAQPMNLQALLRSRDTDQVAMSEPFRLRQTFTSETTYYDPLKFGELVKAIDDLSALFHHKFSALDRAHFHQRTVAQAVLKVRDEDFNTRTKTIPLTKAESLYLMTHRAWPDDSVSRLTAQFEALVDKHAGIRLLGIGVRFKDSHAEQFELELVDESG